MNPGSVSSTDKKIRNEQIKNNNQIPPPLYEYLKQTIQNNNITVRRKMNRMVLESRTLSKKIDKLIDLKTKSIQTEQDVIAKTQLLETQNKVLITELLSKTGDQK